MMLILPSRGFGGWRVAPSGKEWQHSPLTATALSQPASILVHLSWLTIEWRVMWRHSMVPEPRCSRCRWRIAPIWSGHVGVTERSRGSRPSCLVSTPAIFYSTRADWVPVKFEPPPNIWSLLLGSNYASGLVSWFRSMALDYERQRAVSRSEWVTAQLQGLAWDGNCSLETALMSTFHYVVGLLLRKSSTSVWGNTDRHAAVLSCSVILNHFNQQQEACAYMLGVFQWPSSELDFGPGVSPVLRQRSLHARHHTLSNPTGSAPLRLARAFLWTQWQVGSVGWATSRPRRDAIKIRSTNPKSPWKKFHNNNWRGRIRMPVLITWHSHPFLVAHRRAVADIAPTSGKIKRHPPRKAGTPRAWRNRADARTVSGPFASFAIGTARKQTTWRAYQHVVVQQLAVAAPKVLVELPPTPLSEPSSNCDWKALVL